MIRFKKSRHYIYVFLTCYLMTASVFAGIPVSALASISNDTPSLAPMLEQTTPAVVNISTRGFVQAENSPLLSDPFFRRFFNIPAQPRQKETQSLGSGVIIDANKGLILTNNHVVDKADEITVTLRDRRKLKAKLVGSDAATDVAVIQVEPKNLTAIKLADSEILRVGDFVVAIGNPFGLGQTVTSGIVSALGRSGLGIEGYEDFIQTDASINPGNSGGALVNLKGELVGINTAILSPGGGGNVGIGFAIPSNMAKDIMEQLVSNGEVQRGRLGVAIQDLTPDLAQAFGMQHIEGAVISQVMKNSPADRAGLRTGDVIVEVNSRPVAGSGELRNLIGLLRVGQSFDLKILRNGKAKKVKAVITPIMKIKSAGAKINEVFDGAVFAIEDPASQDPGQTSGIEVLSVKKSSPAWHAGLRKGDIIFSANRINVSDFEQLKRAIKRSRRGLLLNIQRDDEGLFLLIQ